VNSLLASRLWVLAEVSPWGYLFRPLGSHEWSLPSPEEIAGKWPLPADRSDWMIRTAHALIVMGRYNEANRLLIEGEKMKLDPSILLGTKASLAASLGEWENAASLSRKALRVDGSNGAAREILIRSLVECGRSQEALGMARKDFGKDDRNEEHLFLLARVANSAGSRDEEIDALRRLVDLQRSRKVPAFTALAYLGQAEAKDGLRGEAMRAFEEILSTPDLPEEQRNAVRSMIDHLSFEKPLPPIGRQFPPDIPDARGSPSPSNP
jgi:tetratricopeptide (TPR) repeat protein